VDERINDPEAEGPSSGGAPTVEAEPEARPAASPSPSRRRPLRRIALGCLVLIGLLWVGCGIFLGPTAFRLWPDYISPLFFKPPPREYDASMEDNLKWLHLALRQYHDSEGEFPPADEWMDAIRPYIQARDMPEEEAMKKFRNPLVTGENAFGYAMNEAAAGQYVDDLDRKLPLIFTSTDTSWNASGEPARLLPAEGQRFGITVDGTIITQIE
jgi:hypothetical protein